MKIQTCTQIVHAALYYLNQGWEISVSHCDREDNRAADWIATYGLSNPIGLHVFTQAPRGLEQILLEDKQRKALLRPCRLQAT